MIWKLLIAAGIGSLVSVGIILLVMAWWAGKIRL